MERSAPSYARAELEAARLLEAVAAGADRLVTRARALPRPPGGRAWARVADHGGADAWLIVWSPEARPVATTTAIRADSYACWAAR
jgi:hypothetical protein